MDRQRQAPWQANDAIILLPCRMILLETDVQKPRHIRRGATILVKRQREFHFLSEPHAKQEEEMSRPIHHRIISQMSQFFGMNRLAAWT